jgi:hypothetical protein
VPLQAVLKGIDRAFESYQRSRRGAGKPLKSLAYCSDAVLEAAEESLEAAAGRAPKNGRPAAEPFSRDELRTYFVKNAAQIRNIAVNRATAADFAEKLEQIAQSVETATVLLDAPGSVNLEDLERRLTVLDEKLQALLASHANEELLLQIRREVDAQLAAYRRKMKAEQLALVEKQYLQKRLLEEFGLPRLSLFYFS